MYPCEFKKNNEINKFFWKNEQKLTRTTRRVEGKEPNQGLGRSLAIRKPNNQVVIADSYGSLHFYSVSPQVKFDFVSFFLEKKNSEIYIFFF